MHGHLWTLAGHLRDRIKPPTVATSSAWSATAHDPVLGAVQLSGELYENPGADTLCIVVHGLGGSSTSGYVMRMAATAHRRGLSTLRFNMRGADRSGEDNYHAGLTDDLRCALESPAVARYERVVVVGFSMGGHVSLNLAADGHPRVSAYAAICAPLDLEATANEIDSRKRAVYRHHILDGLKEMYAAYAARRPSHAVPLENIRRLRTIRSWDETTIVPRFGFDSASDYYAKASAGPRLGSIATPTLYLFAERDPMVTASTVLPHLGGRSSSVEVRWHRQGGHVAFADRHGVEDEVIGWLQSRASSVQ